jgi:putative aminopeptidase FrvX
LPDARKLIEELTNAYGPTGFEGPVRDILRRELAPVADTVETDGIGSLVATQKGKSERPRVMLAAHMDELGLMVKYIDDDGYVKILPLGVWLDQSIINQRWTVLTRNGPVPGVTGIKSIHVMDADERKKVRKPTEMFVDVGATSKQDAETRLGIRPGDPVAAESRFVEMAGGKRYMAKALDDRIGCAAMVGVMKALKAYPGPNTVFGVGTVQEEVGLRGAQTSSYQVNPDIGISLEVGVAGDHPGITKDEAQERLGLGPGIFLHDSSMLPNLKLRDLFVETAEAEGIPFQFNVLADYGEDGAEIQKSRSGAPSINVTVPTRYLHSHTGMIERSDFDGLVALVAAVVRRLDAKTVESVRSFD